MLSGGLFCKYLLDSNFFKQMSDRYHDPCCVDGNDGNCTLLKVISYVVPIMGADRSKKSSQALFLIDSFWLYCSAL